jgi:hypothetical protein
MLSIEYVPHRFDRNENTSVCGTTLAWSPPWAVIRRVVDHEVALLTVP